MSELVCAFSGGKDSTALALRLAELGEDFVLLFTPTGDELPELAEHVANVVRHVGKPLVTPPNHSLDHWIREFKALPNWRMRWCTRAIKIEPCVAYLKANPGSTLAVGLRADEEERQGLYGPYATYRYPLREWGWGVKEVVAYNRSRGVKIPRRTDCAVCPYQQLSEWFVLWRDYPSQWAKALEYEAFTGHTFRAETKDDWPAALKDLGAEFARGRWPRGTAKRMQGDLFDDAPQACRVCSL